MFPHEQDREPDEYTRLVHLLAINEQMINDLMEQYDSGTDAPPARTIEARQLPALQAIVPQGAIAEYRTVLLRYGERLKGELQQYKRVKVAAHELGEPTPSEPTTTKSAGVQEGKKRITKHRRTNG